MTTSSNPVQAILFDVGGPLVDETPDYEYMFGSVQRVLSAELGREVQISEIRDIQEKLIRQWTPSVTKALFWQFLKPDLKKALGAYEKVVADVYTYRDDLTLQSGVSEILPQLAEKYTLALAGNQRSIIVSKLEKSGILKYFTSTVVSEDINLHKPDTRFFLEICVRIGIPPENCVMVGDRLDNDIYPANVLGMRTIWIRVGPHLGQEPRTPEDIPDAVVNEFSEIPEVLMRWERSIQ